MQNWDRKIKDLAQTFAGFINSTYFPICFIAFDASQKFSDGSISPTCQKKPIYHKN